MGTLACMQRLHARTRVSAPEHRERGHSPSINVTPRCPWLSRKCPFPEAPATLRHKEIWCGQEGSHFKE